MAESGVYCLLRPPHAAHYGVRILLKMLMYLTCTLRFLAEFFLVLHPPEAVSGRDPELNPP